MPKYEMRHRSCAAGERNPKKSRHNRDFPSDILPFGGILSVSYHLCAKHFTHQNTSGNWHGGHGECHIVPSERRLLMHGSPAWCPAKTSGRPISGSGSRRRASWLLALESCWSPPFSPAVKATIRAMLLKCYYRHGIYKVIRYCPRMGMLSIMFQLVGEVSLFYGFDVLFDL